MKITICGTLKFMDKMREIQKNLEGLGHTVLMPIWLDNVDYWSKDNTSRVKAKRSLKLIDEHMDKVKQSEAILAVNMTKGDIKNYIGANTFIEIGFAHYLGKKIYLLNPLPDQPYIKDELEAINPIVLNGDLTKIK